jgi:hypothetical protein
MMRAVYTIFKQRVVVGLITAKPHPWSLHLILSDQPRLPTENYQIDERELPTIGKWSDPQVIGCHLYGF